MGVARQYVNPPTCPYDYVKIGDKIYKRDNGNIFDDHVSLDPVIKNEKPPRSFHRAVDVAQ